MKEDHYLRMLMRKGTMEEIKSRVEEYNHDFSGLNSRCFLSLSQNGDLEKLKYLLSFKKSNINEDVDVIYNIIENGHTEMLRYVLDYTNIDYSNSYNYAVAYAWEQSQLEMLDMLLSHKSTIESLSNTWIEKNIVHNKEFFKRRMILSNF